jgi:membrane carboxypeptidase/penicillin-binding protein
MQGVTGITGAAPIWHDFMTAAHQNEPAKEFDAPSGVTLASVCRSNGGLANPWDSSTSTEVFMSDNMPTKRCSTAPKPSPTPEADKNDEDKNNEKKDQEEEEPADSPTPIVVPSPTTIENPRRRLDPDPDI